MGRREGGKRRGLLRGKEGETVEKEETVGRRKEGKKRELLRGNEEEKIERGSQWEKGKSEREEVYEGERKG